jgi:alpha-L-rhamnosidase
VPGGEVKWAEVILDSPYGEVYARWEITSGRFKMTVRVPCNATAEVILPRSAGEIIKVGVEIHEFDSAYREPE